MVFVLALIGAALAVLIFNHETGFSFGLPTPTSPASSISA